MARRPFSKEAFPTYIKYMGSKARILDFVVAGINEVYTSGPICDLFAGSSCLAGALGRQVPMISNDIQNYSSVLAANYLLGCKIDKLPSAESLVGSARRIVRSHSGSVPSGLTYEGISSAEEFRHVDELNRSLINRDFSFRWHLFTKNYSGTWWGADQCLWIDAFRQVAERHKGTSYYELILSSLMHAMAYTSQGTGHYAQYRDAKTESSMRDISSYRKRSVAKYFEQKYRSASEWLPTEQPHLKHVVSSLDYQECLRSIPRGTVYADPPYCFVHYSRFYHLLETLVLYDFPVLQRKSGTIVKGRYREGRHQSPFCIKTKVCSAFDDLFSGVKDSDSNLVLSYSNTGMIEIADLMEKARSVLGSRYRVTTLRMKHTHMTMGRSKDRQRDVEEILLLAKRR